MKIPFIFFGFLAIATVHASTIIVALNVGPSPPGSNLNTVSGSYSGAMGLQNLNHMHTSLAIGQSNTLIDDDNEHSSLAVGKLNYVTAAQSIVGGFANQVSNRNSLTTGIYNVHTARNSLVIGEYNITSHNLHHNGALLGAYNAPVTRNTHLVIGNGTSTTTRNNSFIIYADGDIVITKPQGDISMGIYE